MITEEMTETLKCAAADAELFGGRVESALNSMWRAAQDGDVRKLEDAYLNAKYEAHHFHATMLVVREAMDNYASRGPKNDGDSPE